MPEVKGCRLVEFRTPLSSALIVVQWSSADSGEIENGQLLECFVGQVGFKHDLDASSLVLQNEELLPGRWMISRRKRLEAGTSPTSGSCEPHDQLVVG